MDPDETDAAIWLPPAFVERMSQGSSVEDLPKHLSVIHQVDGQSQVMLVDAEPLAEAISPPPNSTEFDLERLTWGTRFALRRWIHWIKEDNTTSKL